MFSDEIWSNVSIVQFPVIAEYILSQKNWKSFPICSKPRTAASMHILYKQVSVLLKLSKVKIRNSVNKRLLLPSKPSYLIVFCHHRYLFAAARIVACILHLMCWLRNNWLFFYDQRHLVL